MGSLADELRKFNEHRYNTFKRAPQPNAPLPLEPTGIGGDVKPLEEARDERAAGPR